MKTDDFSIIEKRKIKLISIISQLYDTNTLEEIENILMNNDTNWWNKISESEKQAIEAGLQDAEEGKLISHEQVIKNISERFI